MSRFSSLKKYLSLGEAVSFYFKMKTGRWDSFHLKKLKHPIAMRNNPYDFATFEEVLLREEYGMDLNFEPATIIDGGANIGLTSVYFASKYPAAKIVSAEPEKENFSLLRKNAQPYPNIIPLNTGIWSRRTSISIKDTGQGNNAFVVEEVAEATPGSLTALSIEDILQQQQWKTVDILKLDIEGSEKKVFEANCEGWLPRVKILIVELHDSMQNGCSETVFRALSQYNFSKEVQGENYIFFNRGML
jgi:FkbM family methyltransferase